MNTEHFHLTEDGHCAWFECVTCGEELIFSKHARFDEIKKALDAHACVPMGMRLNPVFGARAASSLIHLLIISILFAALLSPGVALGQTAAGEKAGVVTGAATRRPLRFDAGDAAFWAGSAIDVGYSIGKREAGVFRDKDGIFAPGPNLLFKAGLWGGIEFAQHKYPEHRKAFIITKIIIGVTFGAVGFFHNRNVPKAQR